VNGIGKPYLYAPELSEVIDSTEPRDWVTEFDEDDERYSYPAPLNEVGFFEDFFDQKLEHKHRYSGISSIEDLLMPHKPM